MAHQEADDTEFTDFVGAHERRLRQAFAVIWGVDRGRRVAVDTLAYVWEHWDRVRTMENPVGYLFVVGRERADLVVSSTYPSSDEPALPELIQALADRERQVVVLSHAFGWSPGEIAELLEVSTSSVQMSADHAMSELRAGPVVRGMTVADRLRAFGDHLEEIHEPITMGDLRRSVGADDDVVSLRGAGRRSFIAGAIIVIVGGLVSLLALSANDDDPLQPMDPGVVTVTAQTAPSTTVAPTTDAPTPQSAAAPPPAQMQRTEVDPIGPTIEPVLAGTARGPSMSLDWEGVVDSTALDPMPAPSTYVTATPGSGFLMMDLSVEFSRDGATSESAGPRFWRSVDGVGWTPTAPLQLGLYDRDRPPPAYGAYRRIGDEHWIVGFEPPSLWRSADTVEWISVEPPEMPRSTRHWFGTSPALYDAGGRALLLGASGTGYWYSEGTGEWLADPDVVDPDHGIPATDSWAGEWWESLPAATGDTVVIGGATDVSVSTPAGSTRVPAPWTAEAAFVTAVGNTFVAYAGSLSTKDYWFEYHSRRELMLDAIWVSDDGIDWTGPIVPEFIDGPTPALFLTNNDVAIVVTQRGLWTSRDGAVWTDSGAKPVLVDGTVTTVGDGALLKGTERAWFSLDMESWHEVVLPWTEFGLEPPMISQPDHVLAAGHFLYLIGSELDYATGPPFETDVRIIRWP